MSSPRAAALRLSQIVLDSGSPADIPCVCCLRLDRPCIVSNHSKRCAECLRLNQGCSLTQLSGSASLSNRTSVRLAQEVAIRDVLDFHIRCVTRCMSVLERLGVLDESKSIDDVDAVDH
jgi:hypothetical protein